MKDNRDRILNAARARFSVAGIQATTVEEIAREADLSRSSFYRVFRSIEEVIIQLALDRGHVVLTQALASSAAEHDSAKRWVLFVLHAVRGLAGDAEAYEFELATAELVYQSSPEDFARLVSIIRPSLEA